MTAAAAAGTGIGTGTVVAAAVVWRPHVGSRLLWREIEKNKQKRLVGKTSRGEGKLSN